MIRALIFDFDGLIVDTETPDFRSWQEVYREHGGELPVSVWTEYIGGSTGVFDPYDYLEAQIGHPVDRADVQAQQKRRERELFAGQPILPGVEAYLAGARERSLKLGIASSSDRAWVTGHLERVGLLAAFDAILTADDVARTKPDPELFVRALEALEVEARQAIVLEDSPNGVLAAKRAGIFCVAVPNPVTRQLDLSRADLILDSLAEMPLRELLERADARGR